MIRLEDVVLECKNDLNGFFKKGNYYAIRVIQGNLCIYVDQKNNLYKISDEELKEVFGIGGIKA